MTLLFEWKIACQHCERTIRLPDATFLHQSHSPGSLPIPQPPRPLACPHCKHVDTYNHFDPPDWREIVPSIQCAVRIGLTCVCGGSLVVIAVPERDDCQEEAETWIFSEGVCCSSGHCFSLPSAVASE